MSGFRPRDVVVLRPYRDAVPWDLLSGAGDDAAEDLPEAVAADFDLDFVRVGRYRDRPVAAYAIRPLGATRFELQALAVAPAYRGKGLGRWLLGHALGLAETKGGREMVAARPRTARGCRFLARAGFVADPAGLRLAFTPE